ncbi:twin-arginine translocation pathway signal [Neisseria gonorrhoeae]|nr:twin-arginine translocation pathway signal [Neisseria gonorrhoeae]AZG70357.1 twin-arginine translocation pathway signal [Neisseria gonorrhoeae]QIH19945.1 twin-arginine translocation pathway signal [Neisseria gonorrhoeae]ROU43672.1 twin-arginine translocation pathway signal [Neisseria gonorrhoeae]ROU47609.1 twin-arginine translocation pathway signal [Neisseria gonorrhoeae]
MLIHYTYTVMPASGISDCRHLSGKTKNLPPLRRRKSYPLESGCFK